MALSPTAASPTPLPHARTTVLWQQLCPSPAPQPVWSPGIWRPSGVLKWQWVLGSDDYRPMLRTKPQVGAVPLRMCGTMHCAAVHLTP